MFPYFEKLCCNLIRYVNCKFQTCFNGNAGDFSEKAGGGGCNNVGDVISMEGCREGVVAFEVSFGRYEKPGMKIFAVAGVVGLLSL